MSNVELESWVDEQRDKDLAENLERWAESHLEELLEIGEHARVFRLCEKYLDKSA